jgi:Tfp pilus assembly protein PilF
VLAAAAEVRHLQAFYELADPLDANNAAERDARRALPRDPTSARALAVLASVRLDRDWDLAGSASAFRRALDNDREEVVARHWSAWWLLAADRLEEALRALEDASRINPLSPAVLTARSTFAYFAGDYTAAERSARAALQSDPLAFRAHLRLGLIAVMRRDETSAMEHLETARRLRPGVPETISAVGHAYASFGRERQARALLDDLQRRRALRVK